MPAQILTSAIDRLWVVLAERRHRLALYAGLGLFSFVLACASLMLRPHDTLTFAVSDGAGYFAYLPSVVIDRDLDLKNQLFPLGGRASERAQRTPIGRVDDRFPIGVSLTLAPPFLTAHAIARVVYPLTGWTALAVDGYSLIYQLTCAAFVSGLATLTMVLVDILAVEMLGLAPASVGMAALLYWLGSPYIFYLVRQPFMAHVIGAFWTAVALYSFEVARRRQIRDVPSAWPMAALGVSLGMAIVTRPTNITLVLLPIYLAMARRNIGVLARVRALLPLSLAAVPAAAQLLTWKLMSGVYWYHLDRTGNFIWWPPKLLHTLFSSRHGLLFWTPLAAFALFGLFSSRTLRHPVLAIGAASLVGLWFMNSAWFQWWFGGAFGARAFLDASAVFVVGLACYLDQRLGRRQASSAWTAILLSACVLYSWALMVAFVSKKISNTDYLLPWF